jgi:hypothetical protein
MLSADGAFVNIGEPLNVSNRQTIPPTAPERWYTHLTEANETDFLRQQNPAPPLVDQRSVRTLLDRLVRPSVEVSGIRDDQTPSGAHSSQAGL